MAEDHLHINGPELTGLIEACLRMQPLAERRLYEHFYAYVKGICMRYTSRPEDCEEVMDDSFVKMFRNLNKYQFDKPFKAWLRTIVVNTAIDFYRQSIRNTVSHQAVEDHAELAVEERTLSKLSASDILCVVQRLSPAYPAVFMMYAIDGYSHREIAEMLQITEGTSKSNLSKARTKLQEMLFSLYGDEWSPGILPYSVPSNI